MASLLDALAVRRNQLVGRPGSVVFPVSSEEGTVHVRDEYGTLHRVRAREIFRNANDEVSRWLEIALEPLQHAMRNRREGLLRQVEDLREAGRSRSELKQRLAALAYDVRVLEHQGRVLDKVQRRLERICTPPAAPPAQAGFACSTRPAALACGWIRRSTAAIRSRPTMTA